MAGEIKINLQPFFKQMQPMVLSQLKASLQTSQNQLTQQLKADYAQLTSLVAQITAIAGDGSSVLATSAHKNAYSRMLNTSNSLSASVAAQRQATTSQAQLAKLVQQLFVLEHQIMEHLAPKSATRQYEIFYNDPEHGNLTVLDKVIKAEDLYGQQLISMTKGGKLTDATLTLNQVLAANGTASALSDQDKSNVEDLALEAIANMIIWLQELEEMAAQEHLGRHNWRRLMELRLLLGTTAEDNGSEFYNSFLRKAFTGQIDDGRLKQLIAYYTKNEQLNVQIHSRTLGKNGRVYTRKKTYRVSTSQNRGHIYEALIRMRNNPNMTAREALEASLGRDIWWSQGDVDDVQVKTLLGGNTSVGVASLNSIFDLANYLLQLLSAANAALAQLDQYLQNQVSSDMNSMDISGANAAASAFANNTKDALIASLRR